MKALTFEEWSKDFTFQNEFERHACEVAYNDGARDTDVANIIVERCIEELEAVLN